VGPTPATAGNEPVADAVDVPAIGTGAGLRVVLNTGAGSASDDLEQALRGAFPAAEIRRLGEHDDLADALAKAVDGAVALGAAGGDGTISAAAAAALAADLPLLVIPGGTLNHFARALRVAALDDAVQAARDGRGREVDVAAVQVLDGDRRVFVNNSSIGGYPELVALRERLEDRLGKWPAAAVALAVILARSTPTTVSIDGEQRRIWLLFAGNCCYAESGLSPISRRRLDDGNLDIRLLDADRPWSRTRLVAAIVARRLDRALERCAAQHVRVRAAEDIPVARDGEADPPVPGFDWIKAGKLRVYAP
jgi:undecaprenyl-diphosphatase